MSRFGLIAGNGRFPVLFAQSAKKQGVEVIAIAHKGQTLPELERSVDKIFWIKVGQLGRLIKLLKAEKIKDAAMVGGITKTVMFSDVVPDLHAISLIAKTRTLNDDVLLRAVADEIEKQGITIHSSTLFLSELLSPAGCLTNRKPTKKETKDVEFGWNIAKEIGRLDVGQSVVVKNHVVLAVEAIEGTDQAIRRAGELGGGKGLTVVKVSKPQQDMRFDVPAVGPQTITSMQEAGAAVLAVEQGKTLLIDKEELIAAANRAGICIIAR
ncbi:MAG: UDP-2,3-diacylglucosamine diphosphatase LpxI [Deltaproteobacteria bacterium]|nr:UDP-2,3-diacylglucosamine diphosphatase LpxI [Deltaproteobacteria bacterium]